MQQASRRTTGTLGRVLAFVALIGMASAALLVGVFLLALVFGTASLIALAAMARLWWRRQRPLGTATRTASETVIEGEYTRRL